MLKQKNRKTKSYSRTSFNTSEKQEFDKYKLIFDNSPQAIILLDKKGKILEVNKKTSDFLGYSSDGLIGKNIIRSDFMTLKSKKKILKNFVIGVLGKKPVPYELEFKTKTGDLKKGNVRVSIINDNFGKFMGKLAVIDDISELPEIEEALQENAAKYRVIFDNSPEGIIIFDKKGTVIDTNKKLFDRLGYNPEEIVGMNLATIPIIPTSEKAKVLKNFAVRLLGKTIPPYDVKFVAKNGSERIGRISASLIKDSRNRVVADIVLVTDVTEQLESEKELEKSRTQFKELYERSRDGYVVVNKTGDFLDCNSAFVSMVGYSIKQLKNMNFRDITPKKWNDWEIKNIVKNQILKRGYSDLYEKEYIHKNGKVFPVELQAYLIKGSGGSPDTIWYVVRDITERKSIEAAMKESEAVHKTIFEYAPIGMFYTDWKGTILDGNKAAEKIMGKPRKELIGKNFKSRDFVSGNNLKTAIKFTMNLKLKGSSAPVELVLNAKDGPRTIRVCAKPVVIGGKKLILGMAEDISYQKEAEVNKRKVYEAIELRNKELESFNKLAIGRELRMVELKKEISELKTKMDGKGL